VSGVGVDAIGRLHVKLSTTQLSAAHPKHQVPRVTQLDQRQLQYGGLVGPRNSFDATSAMMRLFQWPVMRYLPIATARAMATTIRA
jgi:hypothetical protein